MSGAVCYMIVGNGYVSASASVTTALALVPKSSQRAGLTLYVFFGTLAKVKPTVDGDGIPSWQSGFPYVVVPNLRGPQISEAYEAARPEREIEIMSEWDRHTIPRVEAAAS